MSSRASMTVGLAAAAMAVTSALGIDVTVTLVTGSGAERVSVEEKQVLWKSPFGGWGVAAWPFAVRVDDTPILEYLSAEQKLQAQTMGAGAGPSVDNKLDGLLGKAFEMGDGVKAEDLMVFNLDRAASATVDLAEGRHTIHPFGIEFTLAEDGTLATRDARLRIDAKTRRLAVACHPVTVKMLAGKRSVSGYLQWTCESTSLLRGLDNVFADYEDQNLLKAGSAVRAGFRRVTLYLPPSAPGASYKVNGVKFAVDAAGRVKLAADAKAECRDGREVRLQMPARVAGAVPPAATRMIGVSWFGAAGEVHISCGSATVVGNPVPKEMAYKVKGTGFVKLSGGVDKDVRGAVALPLPGAGAAGVQLGSLGVRVPAANAQWPHRQLVWDVAGGACWAFQTGPLEAQPGAEWSCRITALAGKAQIPATLRATLESAAGGAAGGDMELKGAADVFTGTLPDKPGFWRLRIAGDNAGPLKGQTLGLVLIGDKASAAVSLFTVRNRALYRRGDTFDLLWLAKRDPKAAAAEWPVRLRGMGLDTVVGRVTIPKDRRDAAALNGRIVMDTTALAPGEYAAAVEADGVAGYPFRFRVCQKEKLSDYMLYSFFPVVQPYFPYPGSPVNGYINFNAGGPGLLPFMADGDGALDGALAAYVNAPFGPARESFDRPTVEERSFMALAALGVHNAPEYPKSMAAEGQNPQHTLPENLQNLRRRLGLYMQQHADFPGLDGLGFGWYASVGGFWEYTPRLDGWQGRRNEMYGGVAWELCKKEMAKFATNKYSQAQMKAFERWQGARAWSTTLPHSFNEWLADAKQIRPTLTMHNHKPTNWVGGGGNYPPMAYDGMSHRSTLDYHDHCHPAGCEWRAPAFLAMGNQANQKIESSVFAQGFRAAVIPILFGATGRGLDGINLPYEQNRGTEAMFRIFERFGSMFTARDPLPDVALYWTGEHGVASTILYDLGRLRRPGMMVSPEDVLAGELPKYKVLLLAGVQSFETPEIVEAVRAFEAKGGVILKDDSCAKDMPGRSIGFAYNGDNVFGGPWGLGGDGEWEHVHPWWKFTSANPKGKEKFLVDAFAGTPQLPVTTPDTDILISPLGGKDSVVCFAWDKKEVPLEIEGRWRQAMVMPKIGELQVAKGWYVHNLLTGKPATVEKGAKGQRVPLDFTGFEGAIYLLTRREPKTMAIRAERPAQHTVRLTGWLADADNKPLADPMPFEVTLKGPDGTALFHKFAALGPDTPLDVPVPALSGDARLELVVRDLVLGSTATQALAPAAPAVVVARPSPDFVGGEKPILEFLSQRKGPVTVLLDEEQDMFRPAAEKVAALLKKSGREARVMTWDVADIRPLHLRWYPLKEDVEVANSLTNGTAWAWRINMSYWAAEELGFEHPTCGYVESGPALRHEADVVMFGAPANHRALAQVEPYLRRTVTANYPAPGDFFVHHIWSPFLGGYNALYVGCRDAAGAEAAVASLAALKMPAPAPADKPADKPLVARGGAPTRLEDMTAALSQTDIMGLAYSPSGKRLFVTTASYGEWFFILDPATGEIVEQRLPPVSESFPNWWRYWRWGLQPESETSLRIGLWNGKHLYDLDKGFIARAAETPPHHLPGPGNGGGPIPQAATLLEDSQAGRIYLGGNDRIQAIDMAGRLQWTYEDSAASPDLHYPRGTFPRAVSGDGKVLIVGAFGVHDMLYATGMKCPGVVGIDTATGKLLWKRDGMVLNAGKVVPLDDRFIVIDDDGVSHEIMAADGKSGAGLSSLTGSADWVRQLSGRKAILIVENNHYDRQSQTSRVYIRALDGSGDRDLPVSGRVVALEFMPDNQSFLIATARDKLLRFALDGTLQWTSEVPNATHLRFSPNGRAIAIGGYDGVVSLLNPADGTVTRRIDLNFANNITTERFVKQERIGEVAQDTARTPSAPPPAPSYLTSLNPKKVSFGPNLAPPDVMRAKLKPARLDASGPAKPGYVGQLAEPVTLTLKVEAGKTYLVEMLNAVANPADHTPLLRLEVAVTAVGVQKQKNLPYRARLPIRTHLARHRAAFRADVAGEVTLSLRAVVPETKGEGRNARTTYDKTSTTPVLLGDVVVSAIRFPGRNVLFDGGPASGSKPVATPVCTGYPHQDGSNSEKVPFKRPDTALRMVNGVLVNQPTGWAGGVDTATIDVGFNRPQKLSVIVIYEDASGPMPAGDRVREVTSSRYRIDVDGRPTQPGQVFDNTQLINIFECPDHAVSGIRYTWAGRFDGNFKGLGDGVAHIAQFEAYAAEDGLDVEDLLNVNDDGMPDLSL